MKNIKLILIALTILILSLLIFFIGGSKNTIFTCTTFFDFEKQDKWSAFCKAMDSILEKHDKETLNQINKWLIVNEYSPSPKADWVSLVKQRYPFITVIQKGPEDKGQAASMNIILKRIRNYKYWIHWEETWYCRAPCLDRMLDIIQTTEFSQVQCTQLKDKPNWLDSDAHPRRLLKTENGTEFYEIRASPGTELYLKKSIAEYNNDFIGHWPLYSLLPSINRVEHNQIGEFSTDPKHWPFRFEWDYGRRWLLAGNTKAVLPDGPVMRDNTAHKSTYS
jgi:hypothetical protein